MTSKQSDEIRLHRGALLAAVACGGLLVAVVWHPAQPGEPIVRRAGGHRLAGWVGKTSTPREETSTLPTPGQWTLDSARASSNRESVPREVSRKILGERFRIDGNLERANQLMRVIAARKVARSPGDRHATWLATLEHDLERFAKSASLEAWQSQQLRGALIAHRDATRALGEQRASLEPDVYTTQRREIYSHTGVSVALALEEKQLEKLEELQRAGKVSLWYEPSFRRARKRRVSSRD